MSPNQREAARKLALGRLSEEAVCKEFAIDFSGEPGQTAELLKAQVQARDAEGVEAVMGLTFHFGLTAAHVPILSQLLTADWHTRHEDVARAVQELRDPESIASLLEAASVTYRGLPYFTDGGHAFARKCTWALASINTADAWQKLEQLSHVEDTQVQGYARKRLVERPVKGRS